MSMSKRKAEKPASPGGAFVLPNPDLLDEPEPAPLPETGNAGEQCAPLMQCLKDFNIRAELVEAVSGPVVDTCVLKPDRGVSVRVFSRYADDIALSLTPPIFVQTPVPASGTVGILLPSRNRRTVRFCGIVQSEPWQEATARMELRFAMGRDARDRPFVKDLAGMPYLLAAGAEPGTGPLFSPPCWQASS